MQTQILEGRRARRRTGWLLSLAVAAALPGCANFHGIGSDQHITATSATQDARSLPAEHGHWPAADWANQFGDHQLGELIAEALRNSPTLDQASARIAAAGAYVETARAATEVKVNADASITRQQYTSNALVPPLTTALFSVRNEPAYGGGTSALEVNVWGKNSENLQASLSKLRISEAEQEKVKLTLSTAIARSYNELARLYALRELSGDDIAQRRQMRSLNAQRVGLGLDTAIEQRNVERGLASGQASLTALDGRILDVRYQLAALLGAGPDRGLLITRPALGAGDVVALPDNLPADLVARRPDIVMARWSVDASTHDVKVAKADFYPDINLGAALGLDAFGFGRFLNASSRTVSAGPAVHLPIFDGGALR